MWPLLLRPEPRFLLSVSASNARPLWRFGLTTLTSARRPAEVGLTLTSAMSGLLREVDFLARLQAHVRLLPVAAPADEATEALLLAHHVRDLDLLDLDLEHELDRGLDLGLGRILRDAEDDLLVLVGNEGGLFRDDRREQHRHQALLRELGLGTVRVHPSISSNWPMAALVISTLRNRTRLTGSTSRASSTSTSGRLRDARKTFSSSRSVTTSTVPSSP